MSKIIMVREVGEPILQKICKKLDILEMIEV